VEYFRKAVEIDPEYAAAYAALAEAEFWLAQFTDLGAGLQRGLAAADKAIALAPTLADGYAARAQLRNDYLFDFIGAQADIEKAVAINPADSHIQTIYAEVLITLNRLMDAEAASRKAIELDPLSRDAWVYLANIQILHGQFATARESMERALDIDPGNGFSQSYMAQLELLQGRAPEALAAAGKIGFEVQRLEYVSIVEHTLGHTLGSDNALEDLMAMHARDAAYQIAAAYAWRGENGKAYEWLERAYRQHDGGLIFLCTDPLLRD
jgi:tetratricopeptide (TPR) repeat protein